MSNDHQNVFKGRPEVKVVNVGGLYIGGNNPISVQSMTNTDTRSLDETMVQIEKLVNAGCELVRVAVPDEKAAESLTEISTGSPIPVMADIHFSHKLALKAVEAGVDGLRLNPGNIGGENRVKEVVKACKKANIPIRIGVNSGSLEDDLAEKFGGATPEAMIASARRHIDYLEKLDFTEIIVSLKSTSVVDTVRANQLFAKEFSYPLHIGITEAGAGRRGEIKSAAGVGALLALGLGDTLRVSLTGDPVREVEAAYQILNSLELRQRGINIISCPTCGRTEIDIEKIVEKVEEEIGSLSSQLTIAIMGCEVNGPGEASHADIGMAGGRSHGLIFKQGEVIKKVKEEEMISALLEEIKKMECE